MTASIFPIAALADNYIWTWVDNASQTAWIVDPGDAKPVLEVLASHHLGLAGILLTHHHYDHSNGIRELLSCWPGISVIASDKSPIQEVTERVKEGDEINCAPFQLKVLEIPGHTLDHLAFYNNEMVFCGDTLFSAGCGKAFEGTHEQLFQALEKLNQLPGNIAIYCGHEYTQANLRFAQQVEPHNNVMKAKQNEVNSLREAGLPTLPSTLNDERDFNPFLRVTEPDIIQAAKNYAKKELVSPQEVFSVLRDWKNRS
jgi:hydroxyacylglutathione hydrolase